MYNQRSVNVTLKTIVNVVYFAGFGIVFHVADEDLEHVLDYPLVAEDAHVIGPRHFHRVDFLVILCFCAGPLLAGAQRSSVHGSIAVAGYERRRARELCFVVQSNIQAEEVRPLDHSSLSGRTTESIPFDRLEALAVQTVDLDARCREIGVRHHVLAHLPSGRIVDVAE